eukprot:TRINITY_DN25829_c0_g1_i1.p1 TRINITY_DN25829_c0_g1~~TRINITY_DN25829_c0_g1_i1.p1  ORF type:complete len:527 (+),score=46.33 TRINITY_DN25829_c0_g1_i1:20-1600(+)
MLTAPFLQNPTPTSVVVSWFTEAKCDKNVVIYGSDMQCTKSAQSAQLSRMREDQNSYIGLQDGNGKLHQSPTPRTIWKHTALLGNLSSTDRTPYKVVSDATESKVYTLAPLKPVGSAVRLLLTSDHQLFPNVSANLQKVGEHISTDHLDAIFCVGDLVNVPDRASEWFDDNRGGAFFPCLQGTASFGGYTGAALLQHTPLYPVLGNHDIMGRFGRSPDLYAEMNDTVPITKDTNKDDPGWNTISYDEIFTLPETTHGHSRYYAVTVGNTRVICLFVCNAWRPAGTDPETSGRFKESAADVHVKDQWRHGQFIFEPIHKGSVQYNWLAEELQSDECQQSKFRVVLLHHPMHTLGQNIVPAFTDPVPLVVKDDAGKIKSVHYTYPRQDDHLMRDLAPLLEAHGVQLVVFGHSHLWNRFADKGVNYLETSNVGKTNFAGGRKVPNCEQLDPAFVADDYPADGDPNGLTPVVPTVAPLRDEAGEVQPYLASNNWTAFTILDTDSGTVSSYRFDTSIRDSETILFDQFQLA